MYTPQIQVQIIRPDDLRAKNPKFICLTLSNAMKSVTSPIEMFSPELVKYGRVCLIDCNDSFTYNLLQAFLKLGAPVTVYRSHKVTIDQIDINDFSYLVLSPGPGIPDEGGIVKDVYTRYQHKIPVLGVCLGMQAINEVYGGYTVASPIPVHGKTSSIMHDGRGIFEGIPNPTKVARYHSLMTEVLTDKLQVQSRADGVIMAFRIPDQTAAVQFHPESFLTVDGLAMLHNFLELRI